MENIVCFKTYKLIQEQKDKEKPYRESAQSMNKIELLNELLKYDERIKKDGKDIIAIVRAKILMDLLGDRYEFKYLKQISEEYKRKLAISLYQQVQSIQNNKAIV